MSSSFIAGVDTGGTFTDAIIVSDGSLTLQKVPSQPQDPSMAVAHALEQDLEGGRTGWVRHGSTVATNALLENKGARTGFITNRDFEDLIEIGRQNRSELWDLSPTRATPLVPRSLRFGVDERTEVDGSSTGISRKEIKRLRAELEHAKLESIAIGLLHSYRAPESELALGEALQDLGLPISLSHDVAGEIREFERYSTTIINAAVMPIMAAYLKRLTKRLRGCKLFVMQSSGGTAPVDIVTRYPSRTVLSGPAGGVYGAWRSAQAVGLDRAITLDMGGTSTDVALIDGEPSVHHQHEIAGHTLVGTALSIHTVGAGGGSKAWIDAGGALRVGPESEGATPGPACYGHGGRATVTDAHCALGRLPAEGLLDGEYPLYPERARKALDDIAEPLGTNRIELAHAILDLADVAMEGAIRTISLARGHDPRDFALVAFGGAGGLHAVRLCRALGMQGVVVPRYAGVLSALGMTVAPTRRDVAKSVLTTIEPNQDSLESLRPHFEDLEKRARQELNQELDGEHGSVTRFVDCRYPGQSHELTLPFGAQALENFHREHRRQYGHAYEDRAVELVSLRVSLTQPTMGWPLKPIPIARQKPRPYAQAKAVDSKATTPVYRRDNLGAGTVLNGPALITEVSGTTVLEEKARLRVHEEGHLLIRLLD